MLLQQYQCIKGVGIWLNIIVGPFLENAFCRDHSNPDLAMLLSTIKLT